MRHRRCARPLSRRIFHWFGASILFVVVATSLVVWAISALVPRHGDEVERVAAHLSRYFEPVWDDPAARDRYARNLAEDLDIGLVLEDADKNQLLAIGDDHCHGRRYYAALAKKSGERFGHLGVCVQWWSPAAGLAKMFAVLTILGLVLWGASLKIARRITNPLENVAATAEAIGRGDLARRTNIRWNKTQEVDVLAKSIDDMATRIQRQLSDQRELLAAVSHELRTPLGHLRLVLELLRERKSDPAKVDKAIEDMESEITEIDRLVGELLASSKLDFGVEQPKSLDAKDVALKALDRAGLSADLLAAPDGASFLGDATLLARALANLLDNAERHGGGVTAMIVTQEEGGVRFAVEDDGPGVAPENVERIFQPLQRGESGNGSLGLGLALVARIAEAHGGRATVEPSTEGGARFSVWVPTGP